jgi:hypothetical protein
MLKTPKKSFEMSGIHNVSKSSVHFYRKKFPYFKILENTQDTTIKIDKLCVIVKLIGIINLKKKAKSNKLIKQQKKHYGVIPKTQSEKFKLSP